MTFHPLHGKEGAKGTANPDPGADSGAVEHGGDAPRLPDAEFDELLRHTKASVKREAIVTAIVDYNRRRRLEKLVKHLGTFQDFITVKELERLRRESR